MLTATLITAIVLTPLLTVALIAVCLLWRAAAGEVIRLAVQVADLEVLARHQGGRIDGYRAELDALSLAPAAVAALTPDAEPPIPAGWLTDLHTLPTTHEREYPL